MGYKSRPAFSTGGYCIRECVNKDKCAECFKFDRWELPDTCTLATLRLRAEEEKNWLAYQRVCYIIDKHGPYQKVEARETWEMLKENSESV